MVWALRWELLFCIFCMCATGCDRISGFECAVLPGLAELRHHDSNREGETLVGTADESVATGDAFFQQIQHDDPRSVVSGFLKAIKRADGRTLQRLLTAGAMAACESHGVQLAVPKEHPLAACRVLQTDFLPGESAAAHVRCLWSDSSGDASAQEVVFVLRNEDPGWRIAGMVVEGAGIADVFDLESVSELQSLSAI